MVKMTPYLKPLFLFIILATTAPQPIHSVSIFQYRSLLSLSHSILMRVANLRAERGDISGANRARLIAQKLEPGLGLGFVGFAWSVGWDYVKNYAWRELDYRELHGAASDLNDLGRFITELMRFDSDLDKATWIRRNYGNVLEVSKRLLVRLLGVFRQSGPLREVVETVQVEVVEGSLLRDCLVLGSNDLEGLLQIFQSLVSQHFSAPDLDYDL
ncbi:uncharacterized protein LOC123192556 [Mangifera indica]|uniref:uncharacterized protein LOC123192556 n=1 Tax=Mangifera indica TaxID=29780 RepID=UPI001CFA8331|nr:uncharacterized protein LOC123192556 [Mangifera indica]